MTKRNRNRYFTILDDLFKKGDSQSYVFGRHRWDDSRREEHKFFEFGAEGKDAGAFKLPEGAYVRIHKPNPTPVEELAIRIYGRNTRLYTHIVKNNKLVELSNPRIVS
jgi:hypothetical protein